MRKEPSEIRLCLLGISMKKLKKAYVEITNVCNLSCAFCPGTSRRAEHMSVDRFRTVLSKLSGWTDFLYLHVMGEPLLNPQVAQFLQLCGEYNFRVNITTNGTLIAKTEKALLDSRALRQVNFSLHSHEAAADIKRLDQYLDDIFAFTERALARGDIYVSFRLWNLTSEASDRYNAYVAGKLEERFNPGFSVLEVIRQGGRAKLGEGLFLNSAEVFEWPSAAEGEKGQEGFCLGLRDQIAVLADGTVVPCCLDSEGAIRLGNIFEEELGKILEGDRARAIYDGFSGRRAVEGLCRKCGYRSRFDKDG